MHFSRVSYFAVVISGLFLAGCSKSDMGAADRKPVFKVKGKITMSGGPVANAMISFSPKTSQPVATGRTGSDGTYTLTTYDSGDGAAAGDYVVLVTKPTASPASSTPAGGHDAKAKSSPDGAAMHSAAQSSGGGGGDADSALPVKYSRVNESDLTATVKSSGDNVLDFDLKP